MLDNIKNDKRVKKSALCLSLLVLVNASACSPLEEYAPNDPRRIKYEESLTLFGKLHQYNRGIGAELSMKQLKQRELYYKSLPADVLETLLKEMPEVSEYYMSNHLESPAIAAELTLVYAAEYYKKCQENDALKKISADQIIRDGINTAEGVIDELSDIKTPKGAYGTETYLRLRQGTAEKELGQALGYKRLDITFHNPTVVVE